MNVTPWVWLAGFLPLGALVGLLGSLVVVWQYHIDVEPQLIGLHFLALNAGYVLAAASTQQLVRWIAPRGLAIAASLLAVVSLAALSLVGPPAPPSWRIGVLASVGLAGGMLATALLYALEGDFSAAVAITAHRAAVLFGAGSLLATLIVGLAYLAGSVQIEGALLALIPASYFVLLLAGGGAAFRKSQAGPQESPPRTLNDLRCIAALLLALLLFFQFGNEWAIAGWLPLFIIHRLGTNPALAIMILAAYFLALVLGRLAALKLLLRVDHRRLLIVSILLAMLGYLFLSLTESLPEAASAVLVIGFGFGPIYPLVAERLDQRFSYHPGFYNGTIAVAITGALCAPWFLGFVNASFGIRYLMLLPALGSLAVLVLALLIMFEAHLMTERSGEELP